VASFLLMLRDCILQCDLPLNLCRWPNLAGGLLPTLANLQLSEGLQQSASAEHGEDRLLRVVNQLPDVALYVGPHKAAMRNPGSRRPWATTAR
jgi:hypothetical protein